MFGLPDGQEREFFASWDCEPREMFPIFGPDGDQAISDRADGTILGAPAPGADAPRPQLSPEAQRRRGAIEGRQSFYALAELAVPSV